MKSHKTGEIVNTLDRYLETGVSSSFNYARYLLIHEAPYLDAFVQGKPFPPFEIEIQMSSKCNLKCRWCIGKEVQGQRRALRLPNNITEENIDYIIDGITGFRINDLGINTVKFSGFIGEPLLLKKPMMKAIQRLSAAGFRVGLFTNGVHMGSDTWDALAGIDYVHVSLDAGPLSFYFLKEGANAPVTSKTFDTIIDNIKGIDKARKQRKDRRKLKINIGFVVIPGNHKDIYSTAKVVKEAGADSIRFKCDISDKHGLNNRKLLNKAYEEIDKVMSRLHHPPIFTVHTIHSKEDIQNRCYADWQCKDGCFYQQFLSTIGSDGNVYLCDHNTMPGATPFGNVINEPLKKIWESDQRSYLMKGVPYTCQSTVCPPFGNSVNFFLKTINDLKERYEISCIESAINELRNLYRDERV